MALCFSTVRESSLQEIAKPYLGVYVCEDLRFGQTEYNQELQNVKLELKKNGEYVFYIRELGGKGKKQKGKYEYDEEKSCIYFSAFEDNRIRREFSLKDGCLTVAVPYGKQLFYMCLKQK